MKRIPHFLPVGCLFIFAAALSQGAIHAQPWQNPYIRYYNAQANAINFSSQRFANAQAVQASYQLSGFPYGGGYYNPAFNTGFNPAFGATPYLPPFAGGTPFLPNPYNPGAGVGVGNTYLPGGIDPNNPYNPINSYNPYNPYPPYGGYGGGPGYGAGQVLQGEADVMRAYGQVINAQEQARITREKALQEKLKTRKDAFDLDMYIKANTPTYTQAQERAAKSTLRRIQTNSLPGELVNGKALNYLLDDLRRFPNKKIALEPLPMSEGVLTHLNITKNTFGLGILRDDGRVTWPAALLDKMTVKQRNDLDEQLRDIVKGAYKGKLDVAKLNRVRAEIEQMGEDLVKRVNDVPTVQYMDAKRFLHEFQGASIALEKGEAPLQGEFQRFIEGGRSVQDVTDYMVKTGLRFGPAADNDEPAYRAVHSALATYDIAMNSALGADNKDQ